MLTKAPIVRQTEICIVYINPFYIHLFDWDASIQSDWNKRQTHWTHLLADFQVSKCSPFIHVRFKLSNDLEKIANNCNLFEYVEIAVMNR